MERICTEEYVEIMLGRWCTQTGPEHEVMTFYQARTLGKFGRDVSYVKIQCGCGIHKAGGSRYVGSCALSQAIGKATNAQNFLSNTHTKILQPHILSSQERCSQQLRYEKLHISNHRWQFLHLSFLAYLEQKLLLRETLILCAHSLNLMLPLLPTVQLLFFSAQLPWWLTR